MGAGDEGVDKFLSPPACGGGAGANCLLPFMGETSDWFARGPELVGAEYGLFE
jgi:hypothetical protein